MSAPDVVVVGGGVVGLSIAWRVAGRGLQVVVVDEIPGRAASWAAAGMLAPVTEVHYGEEKLLELNLASARLYPGWAEELEHASGLPSGYRSVGTVVVARDADENAVLDDLFALQKRMGLSVERLRARECRALEPYLSPRIRGGILVEDDHQVDNRALISALLSACNRARVEFVAHKVATLDLNARGPSVILDSGDRIDTSTVVVAAGSWSADIGGIPADATIPLRPVKGQLLHLRGAPEAPIATRTVRSTDVYVVPRGDGRLVVGATMEERGFDLTVTAGAVYDLLRGAYELLPGITELELTEAACGLRPATPDNGPVIGSSGIDGLLYATGHFRNGLLLAPVTSVAIAHLIAGEAVDPQIRAFDPGRFRRAARAAS
ncbi:MAG: glycine oxidase ThiO [Actinomycetota bacterium]|nr:glycine oxidase ThiO [Actinomycetota bacterium]